MVVNVAEIAAPIERINTYERFRESEGLPVVRGFVVEDLSAVLTAVWPRKGGLGAYVDLEGAGGTSDTYVCEIPPGGALNPEHYLFEETIYILEGSGSTSVWYDEDHKVSFEWKAGSLFAIPLNAWHRHHNASGLRPARFVAATSAPLIMNLLHNVDFVFNSPYQFQDRFGGEDSYFDATGKLYASNILEANFIPDIVALPLYTNKARGAGGKGVRLELSYNTTHAHLSEFPVGTYKKAHRHGPDARVIIVQGGGFSCFWPEGTEPQRFDWHEGSMFIPPDNWFHQHFNTRGEPARYLALRWGSARYDLGGAISGWTTGHTYDIKGAQIEYGEEDPRVHHRFEQELRGNGVECRMRDFVPGCTAEAG